MPAGSLVSVSSASSRAWYSFGLRRMRLKSRDSAPTFGAIDMPLSFTTITIGRSMPAGVQERLEGHPAGERAVADHRDDLAVGRDALAHRLLDADRVRDRGRGVAGAHDVVLRLVRSSRRARGPAVLADRVELVAAAGEDLVRVGLVAHVPEHLVARRVEQRVDRHGDLAGAEVGAEVPADLADRVDDQLADLLRHLDELVVVELLQVSRAVDLVDELRAVMWCG